jgi:hypothetical protein
VGRRLDDKIPRSVAAGHNIIGRRGDLVVTKTLAAKWGSGRPDIANRAGQLGVFGMIGGAAVHPSCPSPNSSGKPQGPHAQLKTRWMATAVAFFAAVCVINALLK